MLGFSFPHFDVIKGTAIDYMHCICEGVVNQLLKHWFDKERKNDVSSIFTQMENVSSELVSIKPPSELTRRPRKLKDKKDWKGTCIISRFDNIITIIHYIMYVALSVLHCTLLGQICMMECSLYFSMQKGIKLV